MPSVGSHLACMHIWTDIFTRELIMLVTLLALGSGPAAFLGRRFDAAARLAIAPALGLCVGTCVFTTLIWFTAARYTYWLIPVLAVASVAVGLWRGLGAVDPDRRTASSRSRVIRLMSRLRARDAFALAVVCVVVAGPLSYTLHERHSVGPIGYEVWDVDDYTAEPDAMEQESIRQAIRPYSSTAIRGFINGTERQQLVNDRTNFAHLFWTFYASGDQNLDAAPLSANLNKLIGLHATDTQSLFLIAFLLAGALGAFAAVRYATPEPGWTAPLAGILFAGPFFMQLIADGSQAAICGLALILPIAAVGIDTLRERRIANVFLLALLFSGLIALYPLFVPIVGFSAALVLLAIGSLAWARGRLNRRLLAEVAVTVGGVAALTVVFNLVSFTRDVRYWHDVLNGSYYLSGLPKYHLPFSVLPGWLLQTREFYSLTALAHASAHEVIIGVALPALFIVVMIAGLVRRTASLILLPFVLVCVVLAIYVSSAHHCSYCTDRDLLPIAPLSIGLLALGVAALATAPRRWLRWAAFAAAIVVVIAVAARTRQERLRFAAGAYFLDAGSRALLADLPKHPGPVDIEGYGEEPGKAPGELPLIYHMVSERNRGEVSLPSEYVDYQGLAYLGESNPANPQFRPGYRYVLTRFAGMQTTRRVLARTGSLALEERTGPLDTTIVSGVAVPAVREDADGLAWVESPLHMLLVGGGSGPAWVSLRFKAIVPVTVPHQPGVRARLHPGGVLTACVRATGAPPARKATIALSFPLVPGIVPTEPFALQEPPQGVQLVAMHAGGSCTLTGAH
jgi:hypothetical protein